MSLADKQSENSCQIFWSLSLVAVLDLIIRQRVYTYRARLVLARQRLSRRRWPE